MNEPTASQQAISALHAHMAELRAQPQAEREAWEAAYKRREAEYARLIEPGPRSIVPADVGGDHAP